MLHPSLNLGIWIKYTPTLAIVHKYLGKWYSCSTVFFLRMGLLPLTSVEPESIFSSFYMIIWIGHEGRPPSVLNLGAYAKANYVQVAVVTPE